ncbi:MAG: tail fiber protein [Magnetospirillum sp.]|nr:tail fiber protein [Magnetospirillum sp.]
MSEPYIGQVELFAFTFNPSGWRFCDGTLLPINQYQALYSLLGTLYGGNAQTTFGLPDLRARTPRGQGTNSGSTVQVGQTGGNAAVTFALAPANIPGHTHPATFSPTNGSAQVNIPGTAGSGSITINPAPTISVVPGSAGVDPVANTEYYLTGVSSAANGPCTTTAPTPGNQATLKGLNVQVDASTYKPEIPATSTTITTVTGGTVAVATQNPNPATPVQVPLLNPFLGMNYSIALIGVYPTRD